jgi:hypothetical protein
VKFSERWRLAGIISSEVRFQGFLEMNPSNLSRVKENPQKIAKSIKSSSAFNTFISVFLVGSLAIVSAAMAAFDTEVGAVHTRVVVGMSMFLIVSFVILIFMNLSTATGFFTADAMSLPATLPLTQRDLEDLTLLAFIRVFVAPTILILTVFPTIFLIAFGVPLALMALVGCAATVSLSIGTLVHLASWFRRKSLEVSDSKGSTVVRVSASLGMALGMVFVFGMGSWLPSMIHFIADLSGAMGSQGSVALALVFPFSYGFLASTIQFGLTLPLEVILVSLGASIAYSLLAIRSYLRTGHTLRGMTVGGVPTKKSTQLREVSLSTSTVLKSIMRKDLKLASRNIGSSFVFLIPFFLVIFIFPMMTGWAERESLRSLTALISIEYGNFFGGIAIISIMMFDTQGASIMSGLPLSTKRVLNSKVAIAMIPYVASMVVVSILISMFPLTSPLIPLIPLIQIPCGYTISMTAGAVTYWKRGQGRAVAVNVTSDAAMSFQAAGIGALVGIVPLIGYGVAMILTGQHVISLTMQFLIMVIELVLVRSQITRLLKD